MIYTLTTIDGLRKKRTWGYYLTLSDAVHAVTQNKDNMIDCLYDYLVIEQYGPGIIAMATSEMWFHWNEGHRTWVQIINKPTFLNGTISFAMG